MFISLLIDSSDNKIQHIFDGIVLNILHVIFIFGNETHQFDLCCN